MRPSRLTGRLREMFYFVVRLRWQRSGWIYEAQTLRVCVRIRVLGKERRSLHYAPSELRSG
jgi:hypothetical protein